MHKLKIKYCVYRTHQIIGRQNWLSAGRIGSLGRENWLSGGENWLSNQENWLSGPGELSLCMVGRFGSLARRIGSRPGELAIWPRRIGSLAG